MKAPAPTENQIQFSVLKLLRYVAPAVSMVAIPNAAKRGPAAVRQALREGMAAGFPDVMFLWPRGGGNSPGICFVEFKAPKGKVSDNQAEWLERLDRWGHPVGVARSPEDAFNLLRAAGAPVEDRAPG